MYSDLSSQIQKGRKRERKGRGCSSLGRKRKWWFKERVYGFSLEYREIRPSAAFGARGRTAPRGEGFAWVPDLGSFFKLLEVGFSPYLSFIPILSVLSMFESNEAVRGRLIGPKPWDRIDTKF